MTRLTPKEVRAARLSLGITQVEMDRRLGNKQHVCSTWERDPALPSARNCSSTSVFAIRAMLAFKAMSEGAKLSDVYNVETGEFVL